MSQSDCRSLKRSVQDRLEGIAEGKGYLVGAVQRTLNTAERKGCISRDERDTILSELQDLARTQNTGLVPEIESDIDQAFSDGEIEAPARNPGNPGNPHNNPNDNNNDDEEDFGGLEPQREDPERQRTLEGERAEGETGPQPTESRERARGRRAFEEGQETLGQSGTSRLTEFEEDVAPGLDLEFDPDDSKAPKEEAEYTSVDQGNFPDAVRCKNCAHFIPSRDTNVDGSMCKVVRGKVRRGDVCRKFYSDAGFFADNDLGDPVRLHEVFERGGLSTWSERNVEQLLGHIRNTIENLSEEL